MTVRCTSAVLVAGLWLLPVTPSVALTLLFPANAELTRRVELPDGRHDMPIGPYADEWLPVESVPGLIRKEAWRVDAAGATTAQILANLGDQVTAAGWDVVFSCETEACGGFDFRLAADILPPPEMHVDLGDFRYLAARGPDGMITLLVSRTRAAGYVQVTLVSPADQAGGLTETGPDPLLSGSAPSTAQTPPPGGDAFGEWLDSTGRVVLSDLSFDTGSAQLAFGTYPSLDALAAYLRANPSRIVALVGHTDSSGSLDANIALSRRRAGSVLERLVTDFGIARRQLAAEGMGYLAPIATNLTPEGREANRRVEVIVTSTE